jgi:hypothetical protein
LSTTVELSLRRVHIYEDQCLSSPTQRDAELVNCSAAIVFVEGIRKVISSPLIELGEKGAGIEYQDCLVLETLCVCWTENEVAQVGRDPRRGSAFRGYDNDPLDVVQLCEHFRSVVNRSGVNMNQLRVNMLAPAPMTLL